MNLKPDAYVFIFCFIAVISSIFFLIIKIFKFKSTPLSNKFIWLCLGLPLLLLALYFGWDFVLGIMLGSPYVQVAIVFGLVLAFNVFIKYFKEK